MIEFMTSHEKLDDRIEFTMIQDPIVGTILLIISGKMTYLMRPTCHGIVAIQDTCIVPFFLPFSRIVVSFHACGYMPICATYKKINLLYFVKSTLFCEIYLHRKS